MRAGRRRVWRELSRACASTRRLSDLLVESLGADMARIAVEIEKLRLYVGSRASHHARGRSALVPDARATTIFALVNALGRRDRAAVAARYWIR